MSGWGIELEDGWDDPGWTRVPTNITRDQQLSWKAKGLVAFLAGHVAGFRITREFITGASTDGEASVKAGLKELRDAGYLSYRRGYGEGTYVLHRFPRSQQSGRFPTQVENPTGWEITDKEDHPTEEVDQEGPSSPDGDGYGSQPPDQLPLSLPALESDSPPARTSANTRAANEAQYADEFETLFWPTYPRKIGKLAAHRAYVRARRNGATAPQLADGAAAFAAQVAGKEAQFIAHASTWLNGGRWMDEPEQRSAGISGPRPYQNDDYWSER